MKGFIKAIAIALLTLTALNAYTSEYTYIDYALGITDPENDSSTGTYSSLSGSVEVRDEAFILFDAKNYEDSNEYNYDITALGFGIYTDSGDFTDIYGLAQLVEADLGQREEAGVRITIGLRSSLSNDIEVSVKMKHEDIYRHTSKTYALELRNGLTSNFSLGAGYESAEIDGLAIDTLYGSLRIKF